MNWICLCMYFTSWTGSYRITAHPTITIIAINWTHQSRLADWDLRLRPLLAFPFTNSLSTNTCGDGDKYEGKE